MISGFVDGVKLLDGWHNSGPDTRMYRYCDGKLCNGLLVDTFETGIIKRRAFYKDGQITGEELTYHPNGQLASVGIMKDGDRVGEWHTYYPSGTLYTKTVYWENQFFPLREEVFYPGGHLESIEIADSSAYLTFSLYLSEEGDTLEILSVFDEINSIYKRTSYHDNGQLYEVEYYQYTDEIRNVGFRREYDKEGNLILEKEYPTTIDLE